MTTRYFTSNASTGAGSLAEAVKNASSGDVIRPDETVFERGKTIEIILAKELSVDKNLTFDGGPFRVRLNGGGAIRCARIAKSAKVSFTAFEFVEGLAEAATSPDGGGILVQNDASLVLNRCVVCGCESSRNGGGVYVSNGARVELADSVVFENRALQSGGGAYLSIRSRFTANGSTLACNVDGQTPGTDGFSDVVANARFLDSSFVCRNSIICVAAKDYGARPYGTRQNNANGCVVDVSASEIGFVAFESSSAPFENWNRNAWKIRNLHLLDNASPNPSPYRNSGDVGKMSRYDVEGNFRGRTVDGASACSPGAYETIQADLFWIGGEFTQEQIDAAPKNFVFSNLKRGYNAATGT
ncbi:MAG: hypothetical protein IKU86_08495, partial [Thermoguttaceae bacterium]|nr:hypothetical protein [Thermoguttaceae bacterium]